MNLNQVKESIESIDIQFRHTGNVGFLKEAEIKLLKDFASTATKEESTKKELMKMAELILNFVRKV